MKAIYLLIFSFLSMVYCDNNDSPFQVAKGCYVLPDCVSLVTSQGTVYLANQSILIDEGNSFEPMFTNLAHIEVFANPTCTFKLQSIDWRTPIIDEGSSTNFTTTGLRLSQKVGWDLIAPSAFYDKSLWFNGLVAEYNSLAANCSWDEPWDLKNPHSVKRKTCSVEKACVLHDMLFIRKINDTKQLTVSNRDPPCSSDERSEQPANWWLTKTDDPTLCGHKPDQYPQF